MILPAVVAFKGVYSVTVAVMIKITGSMAVNTLTVIPGISSSLNIRGFTNSLRGDAGTFRSLLANRGPAIIIEGIAIIIPYISTFPILALNMMDMAVGEGCGGKKP